MKKGTLLQILLPILYMTYLTFYDTPQAFETALINRFDVKKTQVQSLYSIYSFANMTCAPFLGYLITKIGYGRSMVLFSTIMSFGTLLTSLAFFFDSFSWIFIGRLIFSICSESQFMSIIAIIDKYFTGDKASQANSIYWVAAKVFQSFGNYVLPKIFITTRTLKASFLSSIALSFGQIIASGIYWLYIESDNVDKNDIELGKKIN